MITINKKDWTMGRGSPAAADQRGATMTMCLGANLGDAVVLAADGRRTMSSGEHVEHVVGREQPEAVVAIPARITWSAPRGRRLPAAPPSPIQGC